MTRAAIAYTCHDAFPSSDVNTQQIFETVLAVTRLGVEVELAMPCFAAGVTPDATGTARPLARYYGASDGEVPDTFRVRTVGNRAPRGQLRRGLFDWQTPRSLGDRRVDLAWTRDPVAAAGLALANVPVVFETFRPDYATRPRFAPWRRLLLKRRAFRGVIVHSHATAAAFVSAGVPRDRVLVAHNGFAPAAFVPALSPEQARRQVGLPATVPLLVYAGHPDRSKGLDLLLDIAAQAPDAAIVIVGADPASVDGARLLAQATARGVRERVILRPRVPPADVAPYLYAADVLVVTPYARGDEAHRQRMLPIKVFSYLAAGRAILAPRLADIEEVLIDDRTARLYDPSDTNDAIAAARGLLADAALRDRLGREARRASAAFTWAARAVRIVEFFESIVGRQLRSATAASASSRV